MSLHSAVNCQVTSTTGYKKKCLMKLDQILYFRNYLNIQLKVFLQFYCPDFHIKSPVTGNQVLKGKQKTKVIAWQCKAKQTNRVATSSSQTFPLQPQQITSSFSSQTEDKLLFLKQNEYVAAAHEPLDRLEPATASRHAGSHRGRSTWRGELWPSAPCLGQGATGRTYIRIHQILF